MCKLADWEIEPLGVVGRQPYVNGQRLVEKKKEDLKKARKVLVVR